MLYFRGFQLKTKAPNALEAENPISFDSPYNTPASFEPLLHLSVPSSRLSFAFDELFALSAARPSHLAKSVHPHTMPSSPTHRDSVQSIVEFGDWIHQQSNMRPSSLLPPAPRLPRHDVVKPDSSSVECRLSAARDHSCAPSSAESGSRQSSSFESERFFDAALTDSEPTSRFPSRADTPSLSHSQCSTSVSSIEPRSPDTIFFLPISSPNSDQHTFTRIPEQQALARPPLCKGRPGRSNTDPLIHHISSPLPSPLLPDRGHLARTTGSSVTSVCYDEDRYQPSRPVPSPRSGTVTASTGLPLTPVGQPQQVSFIDWDDDDGDNFLKQTHERLLKMKKSFSDLRAAERSLKNAVKRKEPKRSRKAAHGVRSASAGTADLVSVHLGHISAQHKNGLTSSQQQSSLASQPAGIAVSTCGSNSSTATIVPVRSESSSETIVFTTPSWHKQNRKPYQRSLSDPQLIHRALRKPLPLRPEGSIESMTIGQGVASEEATVRARKTSTSGLSGMPGPTLEVVSNVHDLSQRNSGFSSFNGFRVVVPMERKGEVLSSRKGSAVSLTPSETEKAKGLGVGRWMKRVMSGSKSENNRNSDGRDTPTSDELFDQGDLEREEDIIAFLRGCPPQPGQT